ncbi:MAG: hypothetical protein HQL51_02550 [Magnetococcales bacterium]|nr:hypothetical protein [Magnetococcales bacterium]
MKKGLILGVAAVAALASGVASAAEVKTGGYYMFRAANYDNTTVLVDTSDATNAYFQRLQLNVDMMASAKSHAHLVTRVIDNSSVQGADQRVTNAASVTAPGTVAAGQGDWAINQLWMETEAWGVGVKAGNMPISLNDRILVNHDTLSFGGLLLSKTFGDVTGVLAHVKVSEEAIGGASANTAGMGASDDDTDLIVLSLLGKSGTVNYQATGAYMDASKDSDTAAGFARTDANSGSDNWWGALTVGSKVAGIDLTGTAIYEAGWDNNARTTAANMQADDSGWLAALRLKGAAGVGEWNAYGFYASQGFNNIIDGEQGWSPTWDMSGPGSIDMMKLISKDTAAGGGMNNAGMSQNIWGVGAGLKVKAGAWTINPNIDYAAIVDKDPGNTGAVTSDFSSMWGGTLIASTEIDTGVVFALEGGYLDPKYAANRTDATNAGSDKELHFLSASMKLSF